jgi:hypothetical protein
MKTVFLIFVLLLSNLNADEITRIESIVNDITKLRINYEKSQEELSLCVVALKDEKDKNSILIQELNSDNSSDKKEINYRNRIKNLENKIKELENSLKTKEAKVVENKEQDTICLNNQIKDNNIFPKLQMKKEFLEDERLESFQASSFRVNKKTIVYDAINGKKIAEWEENTSFTSNQKTKNWIKITGFFVEKVWQKATDEMWLQIEDTKQRDK